MPIPGRASTSSDALAGEFIGDCVVLTVDVTNEPRAASGLELFPEVVTLLKREQMLAVAAPQTRHHHDYKERIQSKNCRRRRVTQGLE